MAGDDREKLSYSERDKLLRERRHSGERPERGGRRAREEEAKRSQDALKVADSLFTDEKGGQAGKALAEAVRAAHGTPELAASCRAYLDAVGLPTSLDLASIFLDAAEKEITIPVLDELLRQRAEGGLEVEGGLKSQLRILAEDFDDDLASRAEELLE